MVKTINIKYNEIKSEKSDCFFDLETTGTNINSDRIVEISYLGLS